MALTLFDWLVVGGYFVLALVVGAAFARRAGRGTADFFLAGRSLPWWLLGTSMVATTFSTDTPNLVTQLVRERGIAGNWLWWAFLVTGMLTVFVFAPLWRRLGLLTDLELYELRYSGRPAAFLRGFRALFLGVVFNGLILAAVTLAATKIGGALFGASKVSTIVACAGVAVFYATVAGFWGVVLTDVAQFALSMVGAVAAAVFALSHPGVGGLSGLVEQVGPRLAFIPSPTDTEAFLALIVIPLAFQWWSVGYPGSEPGGGGYIAQRMLAARDERHALLGTLWFNVAHYALRPWPWILVALASLVVYPDLASVRAALPDVDSSLVGDDLAYPLMLRLLPAGWLGLMVASLAGAYMSTVDTHLNWGASYLVNDVYRRFLVTDAEEEHYVGAGRLVTLPLMAVAAGLTLLLETAGESFQLLLQVGAGTGSVFLARWLWWRVNAWSEISAMLVSFLSALALQILKRRGVDPGPNASLVIGIAITTTAWVAVTLVTRPTEPETLEAFCRNARPPGPGWKRVYARLGIEPEPGGAALLAWLSSCVAVYALLFGAGALLFGKTDVASLSAIALVVSLPLLVLAARRTMRGRRVVAP